MNYIKNKEQFNEAVSKEGLVLVDFFATWCGPCKMLSPIIEKIAGEYSDADIYKLDVDEAGDVAQAFGVYSIPTLIFFKDGKEVNRHVGFASEKMIVSKLDDLK